MVVNLIDTLPLDLLKMDCGTVSLLLSPPVAHRHQLLAVSTPGGEELDQSWLAGFVHDLVEVGWGQVDDSCGDRAAEDGQRGRQQL